MKEHNIPLYALESGDPLSDFDFIGFTLQYELSFTNVLTMLKLGNIPICSKDRMNLGLKNIVVAGGPCACNPEPIADFKIFAFSIKVKRLIWRLWRFTVNEEMKIFQEKNS